VVEGDLDRRRLGSPDPEVHATPPPFA
jgi:hypothetical protein